MKYDINKVAASLEAGNVIYGFRKFILVFCSIFPLFIVITDIGILITTLMGYIEFESNMIFGLSSANLFCVLLGIFSVYLLLKNRGLRNKISLWLEDAITVDARLREVHQRYGNPYRIEVTFDYSGKRYSYYSKEGNRVEGYSKFFINYSKRINGKFKILYSPHYEQVLLLKPKFVRQDDSIVAQEVA